jgi:FkbM family methyltransferase
MSIKHIIRELLIFLHVDLTKNLKYDRLTNEIIKRNLKKDFNCIDIGCHKGEILDLIIKYAPNGKHFAFEPIPTLYNALKNKYQAAEVVTILPYALADTEGTSTFNYVKNAPAYSGIRKRRYDIQNPDIEVINVDLKRLDSVVQIPIDFIKIDVEGAEFGVLKGAKQLLLNSKPLILFECGKGASDYYGTEPRELFKFMTAEIGFKIFTLDAFLNTKKNLSEDEFALCFENNSEYYFVASTN